jgi:hypothetical protein
MGAGFSTLPPASRWRKVECGIDGGGHCAPIGSRGRPLPSEPFGIGLEPVAVRSPAPAPEPSRRGEGRGAWPRTSGRHCVRRLPGTHRIRGFAPRSRRVSHAPSSYRPQAPSMRCRARPDVKLGCGRRWSPGPVMQAPSIPRVDGRSDAPLRRIGCPSIRAASPVNICSPFDTPRRHLRPERRRMSPYSLSHPSPQRPDAPGSRRPSASRRGGVEQPMWPTERGPLRETHLRRRGSIRALRGSPQSCPARSLSPSDWGRRCRSEKAGF